MAPTGLTAAAVSLTAAAASLTAAAASLTAAAALVTAAASLCACGGTQAPEAMGPTADACSGFETDVEHAWGGVMRARAEASPVAVGAELGAESFQRVRVKLDAISADWVRLRSQLCRDHVRGRIDDADYRARAACLDGALLRMRTFATMTEGGGLSDPDALLAASERLDTHLSTCEPSGLGAAGRLARGDDHDATARGFLPSPAPRPETAQAPAAAAATPDQVYDRSRAIVIGIDGYAHMPRLRAAENDAHAVSDRLARAGFEVRQLLGAQATRERIARLLGDETPRALGERDRVLVFFAGHGVSVATEHDPMGYLMPQDARPDAPIATGISMTELQRWLAGYRAKHVLFVADACYSGLALPNRAAPGASNTDAQRLRLLTREPVRYTLVAGLDNQEAWEMHEAREGVFTHYFLAALSGDADENGDGLVTAGEVTQFVTDRVFRYVWEHHGAEQRPTAASHGRGEFVFFVQPSAGASGPSP